MITKVGDNPKWLKQGRDYVRELVRLRDKHTCSNPNCGKKWDGVGRRFHVHHLNGLCGKRSRKYDGVEKMAGLTTLCASCHSKKHGRSGDRPSKLNGFYPQIKKLRDEGMSHDSIAKKYSVSSCAISKFLKKTLLKTARNKKAEGSRPKAFL